MTDVRVNTPWGYWSGGRDVTVPEAEAARSEILEAAARGDKSTTVGDRLWVLTEMIPPAGSVRYLTLLDQMKSLHRSKAAGYAGQDNPDVWSNFREAENWGASALDGCLIRLGDKFRRAQNLYRDPSNDQVGEPLKDTLMDMASYALIAICLLEERDA